MTVRGTERLLRDLRRTNLVQVIFVSTHRVHAPAEEGRPIDEESPIDPKWTYPQAKAEAAQLLRQQHGTVPTLILRVADVYTDQCESMALARQMQRIHERRLVSHLFPGNIAHGMAFLHLDDLVDALILAVEHRDRLPAYQALLLAETGAVGYDVLQTQLGRLIHNEEWETQSIPKGVAKAGAWIEEAVPGEEPFIKPWMIDRADDHYEIDTRRAEEMLGWRAAHRLADSLPRMVDFLKRDPSLFYRLNELGVPPPEPRDWSHEGLRRVI